MTFVDDQHEARRARAQDIALFRYRLIAEALEPQLSTKQRGALVRGIADQVHTGPAGTPVQVSRKSLDRWVRAWRSGGGFEALCPAPRSVPPRTDADVLALAAALKKENPQRTAAQVRRILAARGGPVPSERTLQRHFVREELNTPPAGKVHGRFEAEAPNILWTGDVLHGPVVGRKTYLFAFLDDHSRLVTGCRWGHSEDSLHLAEALRQAIAIRGVPTRLYVDNGACFVDETLPRYCAKLGIRLVHTPPYQPQGRGKIERFFETVRGQFLVEISPDGQPAPGRLVPADLAELNGRFRTWVEREYHLRTHSETGTTPLARWATAQPRHVSGPDLDAAFLWEATRSVHAKTATVKFQGNVYEVDARLAGRTVRLAYSPFDLTGATVPIQVSYRDTGYGTATAHLLKRHTHPKVKTAPRPEPGPATGISYLDLLEHQRAAADGTAHCISYRDLQPPAATRPDPQGQPS